MICGGSSIGEIYLIDGSIHKGSAHYVKSNKCIPILPWETIEEILDKAGFWIKVSSYDGCYLGKKEDAVSKAFIHTKADKIQEAVMLAVIALGKELK